MNNKNINSDELKRRVRRGRAWLKVHFDDLRMSDQLKHYETLVDKAITLGITEQECWDFEPDLPVEQMSNEEVLFYLGA